MEKNNKISKTKTQEKKERKYKKRILLLVLAIFIAYVILGATIPFIRHKSVSQDFKDAFDPNEFWGNGAGPERVGVVEDNTDAMVTRLQLIEEAEEEIIISTYDFNADEAGRDIMAALLRAADRGVRVRILVDGLSGLMDVEGSKWFQALVSHEKIELKIYNPVNILKPWKIQTRLHDKYLAADNKGYILGGRNHMNLFLGDYQEQKNIDRELLVWETEEEQSETSLKQLKSYFEQVWALPESRSFTYHGNWKRVKDAYLALTGQWESILALYPQMGQEPDWTGRTIESNKVRIVTNPPQAVNKEPLLWYSLHKLMMEGKEVVIHTPYIICSKDMYQDLNELNEQGTIVDIITNDVTSGANPWGCTDYLNEQENILSTGVTVHEFLGEVSSHTKTILIDDRISIVGSYNLDMRSTYLNTEIMVVVDSEELSGILKEKTLDNMKYSRMIVADGEYEMGEFYVEKEFSLGKKIIYGLLRVVIVPFRYLL